jgi:hypothetical protein
MKQVSKDHQKNLETILSEDKIYVPQMRYDRYGVLFAPQNFTQFSAILDALKYSGVRIAGWRGQSNIEWPVDCGTVRRIKNYEGGYRGTNNLTYEERSTRYDEWFLNEARMKGFDRHDGRTLSDIEILAQFQHYGAATRLLDITENAYIALWFASLNLKSDGILLGISLDRSHFLDYIDVEKPLQDILNLYAGRKNYNSSNIIWKPQYLYERMRVQQSLFIFGKVHEGSWSSLTPYEFDYHRLEVDPARAPLTSPLQEASRLGRFFACAITKEFKQELAKMWGQIFGYDLQTIYPDVSGFSLYNNSGTQFDPTVFETDPF